MKMFSIAILFILFTQSATASTQCTLTKTINHEPLYYYGEYLGTFSIHLDDTVAAVSHHIASTGYPYYQKTWNSKCPGGLEGGRGTCYEFTVYPNDINFQPSLADALKDKTGSRSNRGAVRILTNHDMTYYVYTTDHYSSFCGPYKLDK